MLNLFPRLLPFLALLGLFAGSSGWVDRDSRSEQGFPSAIAANGMAIDPDGATVTITEPTDPDH